MKIAACLSVLALAACQTAGPATVETGSYLVDLTAETGGATMPDHLVFGPGGFESTICRSHGFQRAACRTRADGGATAFAATSRNDQSGCTEWRGSIRGEAIEGTMVSTDDKGSQSRYRFRGHREHGPFDGRVFAVELAADADHRRDADDLVFQAGSFDSTICHGHGFGAAPYTVDGNVFTATTVSAEHGSMAWQGTIDGDAIRGVVIGTDEQGRQQHITFAGSARR